MTGRAMADGSQPEVLERIADELVACRFQPAPAEVQLYPHVGVDGDALGSCLALLLALAKIGVKARLLLDEPIPDRLAFLPGLDQIEPFDESKVGVYAAGQRLALLVDCNDSSRVGRRQTLAVQSPLLGILDHHIFIGECGPLRCVDTAAAAVGETVFDLLRILEQRLQASLFDLQIATLLMTAIISDTGGFVFSNTSARTFLTAASLMTYDVNLREITYQLFDLTSQSKLRLMGRLFGNARFSRQGRLAVTVASRALLAETGASDGDLEGLVNHLRNVAGVEVAFLVREAQDGSIRVNIRTSDHFNAASFAARFGGGGHAKAAGLTLTGVTPDEAAELLLNKAGELL
jgi:bifunctional oligoribonuclease and PAP phosphatase NrnA